MFNVSHRLSVLICISLFVARASFASSPLPAAGAGAGLSSRAERAPVFPRLGQAGLAQGQVQQKPPQGDPKRAQERSDKTRKALEKLVQEMHSNQPTPEEWKKLEEEHKLKNQETREGATVKALFKLKVQSTAKNTWAEELVLTTEKSNKKVQLTTRYSLAMPPSKQYINIEDCVFHCEGSRDENETMGLLLHLLVYKQNIMFNTLAESGNLEALKILLGNGLCVTPSEIHF